MNLSRNGPQYFATLAATLGNLVMGTCIAWSSPASPLLQLPPDQVTTEMLCSLIPMSGVLTINVVTFQDGFSLTKGQVSWVGSLMPVGALIGK